MLRILVLCIFLAIWPFAANAFKEYATEMSMNQPDPDGLYRIRLELREKLSMSAKSDGINGSVEVMDYYPDFFDSMPWIVRDSDQTHPCFAASVYNASHDYNMSTLITLHGLHQVTNAFNDSLPGPPIVVPLGAEVLLTIANRMETNGVTVHVHGMDKRGLWFTDGVAYVQQCPIPANSDYTYRFIADTPGTHWYHGHMAMDRGAGILGPFIVKTPNEPVLREYVMMIQDWPVADANYIWLAQRWRTMKWQWGFDLESLGRCWAPTKSYDQAGIGGTVALRTLLVNGKGWHNQDDVLYRPETLPWDIFKIKRGEQVRFRVINGGGAQMLMLTIDDHKFTVISADGYDIEPLETDSLVIMPGERYDVIVTGLTNPRRSTFPIVIETMEHFNKTLSIIEPYYGGAKLLYEDVTPDSIYTKLNPDWHHKLRCTPSFRCLVVNCPFLHFPTGYNFTCISAADLRSAAPVNDPVLLSNTGFPSNEVFEEHFINVHYDSHMNGWMFTPPHSVPYFHQNDWYRNVQTCNRTACPPESDGRFDDNCFCFYHLNVTLGAIVQLTLYNMGYGGGYTNGYAHPFHMHGAHYYLVKMGYPTYNSKNAVIEPNQDMDCEETEHCNEKEWRNKSWLGGRIPEMNQVNPTFRDTVPIPMGGYITVRFRATNPGWWYAHCHLIDHNMAGMAFAIKIGDHDQMPKPPANAPLGCGFFDPPPLDPSLKAAFQQQRHS